MKTYASMVQDVKALFYGFLADQDLRLTELSEEEIKKRLNVINAINTIITPVQEIRKLKHKGEITLPSDSTGNLNSDRLVLASAMLATTSLHPQLPKQEAVFLKSRFL